MIFDQGMGALESGTGTPITNYNYSVLGKAFAKWAKKNEDQESN